MKHADLGSIQKISIFADLDSAELGILLGAMNNYTLPKDSYLFREGDSGREMYVIKEGRIAVTVHVENSDDLVLAEIPAGNFIGEMSLIEDLPRSASCRALADSALLGLDNAALGRLMESHSGIAAKILYRVLEITASRLQNTGALLSSMVQWGEKARLRVITDECTGLFNRRFLDDALQVEFRKSITGRIPLSLAMVDLDHFGSVNKTYDEAFGDTVILRASGVFRSGFRNGDILARYGGDEFTFLFPGTTGAEAQRLCAEVCRKVAAIEFPEHPEFRITASMGIASAPDLAHTLDSLKEKADKALYSAKEGGRNRAVLAQKEIRPKRAIPTIAGRNRVIEMIITIIRDQKSFLLLGHELPDEDCISSLVAMSLLIKKFGKDVTIFIRDKIPEQLSYLINICAYNHIDMVQGDLYTHGRPDVIFVLDTPKPDMIAANPDILQYLDTPDIPVVEFDHHLSADAAFSGNEGLCLVTRATSTCELIALFCCKIQNHQGLLESFNITELFSRNLVLSMLTGMIGDTRFGATLKTSRDIFFYNFFNFHFGTLLRKSVHKNSTNYSSTTDIYKSLESLSGEEKDLYQILLERARYSGRTGYIILDEEDSRNLLAGLDYTLFVKVVKATTDFLSEKSGTMGLTVFYDPADVSDLVQFRVRLSRSVTGIDLRTILTDLSIRDGGGHPGAIGFRFPRAELQDLYGYVQTLLKKLDTL